MSDILDEIKEQSNEQRFNRIVGSFTIVLLICGIVLIVYLGVMSWYQARSRDRIQQDGITLIRTVHSINYSKLRQKEVSNNNSKQDNGQNESKKIEKLEKLAAQDGSIYTALANFYLASVSLMQSNSSKAIYYYERVAKNTSYPNIIRQYANLVALNAKLQYDRIPYESAIKQCDASLSKYMHDDGKIDDKLFHNEVFANNIALTAVAVSNAMDDQLRAQNYLQIIGQHHNANDNLDYINHMLDEYLKYKISSSDENSIEKATNATHNN